jgi:hypothetical protein
MEETIITDFVTGDSYDFDYTVSNVPTGQTVVSGYLSVKNYARDADADALIFINIGTILNNYGLIQISGLYTLVTFTLNSSDTSTLLPAAEYFYDAVIITDAGKVKTIDRGRIQPVQDVTRLI